MAVTTDDIQDGIGNRTRKPGVGWFRAYKNAAPAGSEVGYAFGCQWTNYSGSVGSILYVNTGTNTSATWSNII